jgi:hypothetical protein
VQLRDLSPVLSSSGPFVTVLVGAESAVEQAADRYEMAWKAMAQQLEQQGVPRRSARPSRTRKATADEASAPGRRQRARGRSCCRAGDAPAPPTTRHRRPLPDLLALVTDVTSRSPTSSCTADRTGADVVASSTPAS